MKVDPTLNVIALVKAETKRQDDLRELDSSWMERVADMRSLHSKELRELESARINAIRQVDVTAVSTAAAEAQSAIKALAVQLDQRFNQITDRLAALEKSSYEGQGKGLGMGTLWSTILGIGSFLATLILIGTFVFSNHTK